MSILFAGMKRDFLYPFTGTPATWVSPATGNGIDAIYCDGGVEMTEDEKFQRLNLQQTPVGVMWIKMNIWRAHPNSDSRLDGYWMTFKDAAGDSIARADSVDGKWRLEVYGDTTVTGPSIVQSASSNESDWTFKIDVTGSSITVGWYVLGSLMTEVTSTNTTANRGVCTVIDWDLEDVMFEAIWDGYFRLSELIITDGDEDCRLWRCAHLPTTTAGNYSTFDSGDYSIVDDNDDTTSANSSVVGQKLSWNLDSLNAGVVVTNKDIAAVVHVSSGVSTGAAPAVTPFIRTAGTDYLGTKGSVTNENTHTQVWALNPATSLAWTFSEINAGIEVGLQTATP